MSISISCLQLEEAGAVAGEGADEGDKIAYLLQWQNHSIGSYVCHWHIYGNAMAML